MKDKKKKHVSEYEFALQILLEDIRYPGKFCLARVVSWHSSWEEPMYEVDGCGSVHSAEGLLNWYTIRNVLEWGMIAMAHESATFAEKSFSSNALYRRKK